MIIYIKIFAIKFFIKVILIKNNRSNFEERKLKIRTLIFIYGLFNLIIIYILSYEHIYNIHTYIIMSINMKSQKC